MFDLWPWNITLTCHPSKYLFSWDTHACLNIKSLTLLDQQFWAFVWILTLKDDLEHDITTLNMCGNMRYTCMLFNKYISKLVNMLWVFDLEIWHWPLLDVQIHMKAKYQDSISTGSNIWSTLYIWPLNLRNDIDLIMSPLKMFMRYTCMTIL